MRGAAILGVRVAAGAAVFAAAILVALGWRGARDAEPPLSTAGASAPAISSPLAAAHQAPSPARSGSSDPPPPASPGGAPSAPPLLAREPANAGVDLEALRRKLPQNLYWELDAPTDDPRALREREERARRWDVIFGRIQSGAASEEEIASFYDHRRRVSEDYRALSLQILGDQGERLDERERGLHELNVRMHTQRLEEIPRKKAAALERKRAQDERRENWERAGRPQEFP